MNVEEFVRETLVQIVKGVQAAKGRHAGTIAPKKMISQRTEDQKNRNEWQEDTHSTVDFDIAVTVETSGTMKAEGKVGIKVVASVEGSGEATHTRGFEHRVKFSVPVTFT